jgi:6,7-dimethyl-8-ribityllumazine synthase
MPKVHEGQLNATGKHFAIVVSRFNDLVTTRLLDGTIDCLKRHGAADENIEVAWVPGAFELPIVAQKLALTKRFDVITCLGAIVRSDTPASVSTPACPLPLASSRPIPSIKQYNALGSKPATAVGTPA